MKLSNFTKTFDLKEIKKGYFPHKFYKPANFNYYGPYPCKEDYDYGYFNLKQKEDFDKFYEQNKFNLIDIKHEIETYCESDVILLAEGCLKLWFM